MLSRCFLVVLVAVLNAACIRQYSRPQFDPEHAQFPGIASALLANDTVDVLFVHGMCTHKEAEWIDDKWRRQIKKMLTVSLESPKSTLKPSVDEGTPQAELIKWTYKVGDKKELRVNFLLWSPLTAPIKRDSVQFDNPKDENGEFAWRRAWLNGKAKTKLVNDCLSDPMIYAGVGHSLIKSQIEELICKAFTLDYNSAKHTCVGVNGDTARLPPVFIVTESLGSKITLDALTTLVDNAQEPSALHDSVASIPQIFMLANQLPLLGLTDPEARSALQDDASGGSIAQDYVLRKFAAAIGKSRSRNPKRAASFAAKKTISIVAFTDPNDLLSYRLRPTDYTDENVSIEISNVIASNTGALLGFIAAMPTTAHKGHPNNRHVMRLVLCGRRSQDDCAALRDSVERSQ